MRVSYGSVSPGTPRSRETHRGGLQAGGEGQAAFATGVGIHHRNRWGPPRRRAWLALALALVLATTFPFSGALAKPKSRSSGGGSAIAAAIVVDMNSGRVLYQQAPDTPRYPASLTKMMTLYMLFTYLRAGAITTDSELVVTPYAASQSPTKLNLMPGATISTADAINALVTLSANARRNKADAGQPGQHGISVAKIPIVRVREQRDDVITAQRLVDID